MRYIDFNLFFRFILIFQNYTDEVDDIPEALVGGMASLPGLLLDSRSQKTSKVIRLQRSGIDTIKYHT